MTNSRKCAAIFLIACLVGGLFTAKYIPSTNVAKAVGPASGATSNTIGAVGQSVSLFVPAGGAVRVGISGSFTGSFAFQLNQGSGAAAVNLYNITTGSATDQSTTGTGSWLYTPLSGNDGTLIIQASAWTSGTAVVSIVDLIASPQKFNVTALPSAARTTQTNSADQINFGYSGVIIYLNCTVASGTGGLTLNVQVKDPLSGAYVTAYTASSVITGVSTSAFALGPVDNWTGTNIITNKATPFPDTWRVQITVGDASSYTYSVSTSVVR